MTERARLGSRPDSVFFPLIALTAAIFVVIGFGPTYFFKAFTDAPVLRPELHWHGLLFSAWLALLIVQTILVRRRQVSLHRRLGMAGIALAILMLVVGMVVSVQAVARSSGTELVLAITFGDLALFATFIALAALYRKRSAAHKRLMVLATASIIPAATARWTFVDALFIADPVSTLGCVLMWGMADLIFVAGAIYDVAVRHTVHPAYLWGGLAIIASQAVRIRTYDTEVWHGFTELIRQLA